MYFFVYYTLKWENFVSSIFHGNLQYLSQGIINEISENMYIYENLFHLTSVLLSVLLNSDISFFLYILKKPGDQDQPCFYLVDDSIVINLMHSIL